MDIFIVSLFGALVLALLLVLMFAALSAQFGDGPKQ